MQKNPMTEIREEVIQILKTVLLLERAYSQGYIRRLVLGEERFPLKNTAHKDLETFGILEGVFFSRINGIIEYLIRTKYLEIRDMQYGTLLITELGEQYLQDPQSMQVALSEIRQAWYESELSKNLRILRKDLAEQRNCEPYEIYNNFSLGQVVKHLPETLVELSQIVGITDLDESIKLLIVAEIEKVVEKKIIDEKTGIYTRSYRPSHRKVKELYVSGMAPNEIAKRRKIKLKTVEEYLTTLHEAGELDIKPYIEETVDSKVLHKASQYFKQATHARLKEAHEVLGIDYDTLRKCRTYVSKVMEEPQAYVP